MFVSGTVGLDDEGAAGAGIDAQLSLILRTISVILGAAGVNESNVTQVRSYLTHPDCLEINAEYR
jgi:enamine deaminase RidA (YjgF/YER057c/UK114 family)